MVVTNLKMKAANNQSCVLLITQNAGVFGNYVPRKNFVGLSL